jgi:release factor glutamine methyltransferase
MPSVDPVTGGQPLRPGDAAPEPPAPTAPLGEWVAWAEATLQSADVPSPRADAEWLAAHVAGQGRGEVRAAIVTGRPWPTEPAALAARYAALVSDRAARVPLQHLTGTAAFRGLELAVGPGVFIPRPETELLAGWAVEAVAEWARTHPGVPPRAADLCTGSGAIAAALAAEVPAAAGLRVTAIELDPQAHAWAERNLAAYRNVDLRLGDATRPPADLAGRCGVIVSNPPYVPAAARPRDPEVARHDPPLALYGGDDGLDVMRGVIAAAGVLAAPGAVLLVEHGEAQGAAVRGMVKRAGLWQAAETLPDLTGRDRVTRAHLRGANLWEGSE